MKLVIAYLALQIVALAILGFRAPLMLVAIPLCLIASYAAMILLHNFFSGRGFRL